MLSDRLDAFVYMRITCSVQSRSGGPCSVASWARAGGGDGPGHVTRYGVGPTARRCSPQRHYPPLVPASSRHAKATLFLKRKADHLSPDPALRIPSRAFNPRKPHPFLSPASPSRSRPFSIYSSGAAAIARACDHPHLSLAAVPPLSATL